MHPELVPAAMMDNRMTASRSLESRMIIRVPHKTVARVTQQEHSTSKKDYRAHYKKYIRLNVRE